MLRKEIVHGLGFSRASAVQGIHLGWLHPKKLNAILCSLRAFLSLRRLVFGVEKCNLGFHNPLRNNCREPKITQAAPGALPKKGEGEGAFLGLLGYFSGGGKKTKILFLAAQLQMLQSFKLPT